METEQVQAQDWVRRPALDPQLSDALFSVLRNEDTEQHRQMPLALCFPPTHFRRARWFARRAGGLRGGGQFAPWLSWR